MSCLSSLFLLAEESRMETKDPAVVKASGTICAGEVGHGREVQDLHERMPSLWWQQRRAQQHEDPPSDQKERTGEEQPERFNVQEN
mmetsp:Transcript_36947/g.72655  ORF Transcript_36947/g.72655 Transcript_36947/m.72655 type:complete len:86 (+) Transcript_36947:1602-1859(+)